MTGQRHDKKDVINTRFISICSRRRRRTEPHTYVLCCCYRCFCMEVGQVKRIPSIPVKYECKQIKATKDVKYPAQSHIRYGFQIKEETCICTFRGVDTYICTDTLSMASHIDIIIIVLHIMGTSNRVLFLHPDLTTTKPQLNWSRNRMEPQTRR